MFLVCAFYLFQNSYPDSRSLSVGSWLYVHSRFWIIVDLSITLKRRRYSFKWGGMAFINMVLIIFCKCFPNAGSTVTISHLKDLTRNGTSHIACGVTFKTSTCTFRVFPSPLGCADLLQLQGCLLSAPAWLRVSSLARPLDSLLRAPQMYFSPLFQQRLITNTKFRH